MIQSCRGEGGVVSDFVISYISWDLIIGVIRRYQTYDLPGPGRQAVLVRVQAFSTREREREGEREGERKSARERERFRGLFPFQSYHSTGVMVPSAVACGVLAGQRAQ